MTDSLLEWRSSLKASQKRRTYKHFDEAFNLDDSRHFELVKSQLSDVGHHQFLPFIKFTKKEIRYKRDDDGVPHRSLKERPIMYASHMDAHIYSFYSHQWSIMYEALLVRNDLDANVIAYRKIPVEYSITKRNKNNTHFSAETFQSIKDIGDCVVIVADISKFFDHLNHRILKDQLCQVLAKEMLSPDEYTVFRSLTAYRYVFNDNSKKKPGGGKYAKLFAVIRRKISRERHSVAHAVYECGKDIIKSNRTPVGIPQGSPASGLLANIYLADFDNEIHTTFPEAVYRRYSDDIILIVPTEMADKVFPYLRTRLNFYQLDVNPAKAFLAEFGKQADGSIKCISVKNGEGKIVGRKYLDYLGFEFDGDRVLLRGKTLQRAYKKGDKKVGKFYQRQTSDNPRRPHRRISNHQPRTGKTYIDMAEDVMKPIGSRINSQNEKLSKFIRKKKRYARKLLK